MALARNARLRKTTDFILKRLKSTAGNMYSEMNKQLREEEERAVKSRIGSNLYSYLAILAYRKKVYCLSDDD